MKKIEDLIEEALKTEPAFHLGKDFKERVIRTIRKKERASQRKLYFWMALGTLVIVGFGYGMIAYFLPSVLENLQSIKTGTEFVPLAVMVGVIVVIIQYLDKRLVKDRFLQI